MGWAVQRTILQCSTRFSWKRRCLIQRESKAGAGELPASVVEGHQEIKGRERTRKDGSGGMFKGGHMLTVKTEGEYIIPGAWLVPFTSGSQRKCGLTTCSWTHSWHRAPPGSRKPGCPISQMRNPTCRKTNVFIKCDLTPALSHMVWQGLRSAL